MIDYANEILESGEIGNDGVHEGNPDVSFLINGRIINIGYVSEVREGGLAIDYINNNEEAMRIVFGYNDFGLWTNWHGEIGKIDAKFELCKRFEKAQDDLCENAKEIVENISDGSFSFTDGGSPYRTIFTLSLEEIKMMNEDIARLFKMKDKNIDEIIWKMSKCLSD